jgi:hypothetical protein
MRRLIRGLHPIAAPPIRSVASKSHAARVPSSIWATCRPTPIPAPTNSGTSPPPLAPVAAAASAIGTAAPATNSV